MTEAGTQIYIIKFLRYIVFRSFCLMLNCSEGGCVDKWLFYCLFSGLHTISTLFITPAPVTVLQQMKTLLQCSLVICFQNRTQLLYFFPLSSIS